MNKKMISIFLLLIMTLLIISGCKTSHPDYPEGVVSPDELNEYMYAYIHRCMELVEYNVPEENEKNLYWCNRYPFHARGILSLKDGVIIQYYPSKTEKNETFLVNKSINELIEQGIIEFPSIHFMDGNGDIRDSIFYGEDYAVYVINNSKERFSKENALFYANRDFRKFQLSIEFEKLSEQAKEKNVPQFDPLHFFMNEFVQKDVENYYEDKDEEYIADLNYIKSMLEEKGLDTTILTNLIENNKKYYKKKIFNLFYNSLILYNLTYPQKLTLGAHETISFHIMFDSETLNTIANFDEKSEIKFCCLEYNNFCSNPIKSKNALVSIPVYFDSSGKKVCKIQIYTDGKMQRDIESVLDKDSRDQYPVIIRVKPEWWNGKYITIGVIIITILALLLGIYIDKKRNENWFWERKEKKLVESKLERKTSKKRKRKKSISKKLLM